MRKFMIAVLFCFGLLVAGNQQGLSQEAEPVAAVEQLASPQVPLPATLPAMQPVGMPGGMPPIGMPGGMPPVGMPAGGMPPMGFDRPDPRFAAGMREQLTMEYRKISQMLGQVDPQDTQFIELLRKEQASIVEQLRNLEAPAGAPTTRTVGEFETAPALSPAPPPGAFMGPTTPLSAAPLALPPNWQQLAPEELARILAEQPAVGAATRQLPPLPSPAFQPNNLPNYQPPGFGGGTPAFGGFPPAGAPPMGGMPPSPWGTPQPSSEIVELKETVAALQGQIEQMRTEIRTLNTQMQLLNQNILLKMSAPDSR